MIKITYKITRLVLFPFLRYFLPLLSRRACERLKFELRNNPGVNKASPASIAFEVSSEGELEQIYSVLELLLSAGKDVELIYCSQSTEERVTELKVSYPDNLRVMALPILSYNPLSDIYNPGRWITAKKFVLCRYDFFPELMFYGKSSDVSFVLISASLGDWDRKSWLSKYYLKYCYKSFSQIVAVSQAEKARFRKICGIRGTKIEVFDFRTIQIMKRSDNAIKKLSEEIKAFPAIHRALKDFAGTQIVLGSYWDDDFEIVEKLYHAGAFVMVAPHELSEKNQELFLNRCRNSNIRVFNFDENTEISDIPKASIEDYVLLFTKKGLLCEVYSLFQKAYVGGGFKGKSIHSVLEPYLSGCRVVTGPNIQRSSEFDIIKKYDAKAIYSFDNIDDIVSCLNEKSEGKTEYISFGNHYEGHLAALLSWLELLGGE